MAAVGCNIEQAAGAPARSLRVLHVIPSLGSGGADAMLAGLVRTAMPGIEHHIHTLMPAENFYDLDERWLTSGTGRRGVPGIDMVRDLRATAHRFRPHLVHGWMYHANLATVALAGKGSKIIWSLHNGALVPGQNKRSTMIVDRLCARLSHHVPAAVVYVTATVRGVHEAVGYARRLGTVIGNGVDLGRFACRPWADVPRGRMLHVVQVGRYDPAKGQHFLIDAVARHPERDRLRLTLVGHGCDTSAALRDHVERAGLADRCTLRGAVRTIEGVYAAADIVALPSFAEAFPMTLLEAAATGAVIVASRVGENERLGLDARCLFQVGDGEAFEAALSAAIAECDRPTGMSARNRHVAEGFGLATIADRYAGLYRALAEPAVADRIR